MARRSNYKKGLDSAVKETLSRLPRFEGDREAVGRWLRHRGLYHPCCEINASIDRLVERGDLLELELGGTIAFELAA